MNKIIEGLIAAKTKKLPTSRTKRLSTKKKPSLNKIVNKHSQNSSSKPVPTPAKSSPMPVPAPIQGQGGQPSYIPSPNSNPGQAMVPNKQKILSTDIVAYINGKKIVMSNDFPIQLEVDGEIVSRHSIEFTDSDGDKITICSPSYYNKAAAGANTGAAVKPKKAQVGVSTSKSTAYPPPPPFKV